MDPDRGVIGIAGARAARWVRHSQDRLGLHRRARRWDAAMAAAVRQVQEKRDHPDPDGGRTSRLTLAIHALEVLRGAHRRLGAERTRETGIARIQTYRVSRESMNGT
jgi:hypothetical protein